MPTITTRCPDDQALAAFATGSLAESEAEAVCNHLDQCSRCRHLSDRFVANSDSLMAAVRRQLPVASGHDQGLVDRWIGEVRRAETLADGCDSTVDPSSREAPRAVDLDLFVAGLRKSQLLGEHGLDALLGDSTYDESLEMARDLVATSQLTKFQARALLRGRWKGLVLGSYEVLDRIGRGGMGQVYRARHRVMGREVCLKVLHAATRRSPRHLERFQREAQTIAALDHPNIVVAHDANQADGIWFLAMELIRGSDLARYVRKHGPLRISSALRIIRQTADALEYAHARGIIHRDIKPHNLMVDTEGNVKVLDLGLARMQVDKADLSDMTKSGAMMGTVDYMAPEQAVDARNVDARADVYSLGCTLFFLLTGEPPYGGDNAVQRLIAHRESSIPRLSRRCSDLPDGLDVVLRRSLAKRPEHRYSTVAEFAEELENVCEGRRPDDMPGDDSVSDESWRNEEVSGLIQLAETQTASSLDLDLVSEVGSPAAVRTVASTGQSSTLPGLADPYWRLGNESQRRPRHNRFSRRLWIGIAATLVILCLVVTALAFLPLLRGPVRLTKAAGGPGRVLLVIPSNKYDDTQYTALKKALDRRGIHYVTASEKAGAAHSNKGRSTPVVALPKTNPKHFDAVIFCGQQSGKTQPQDKYARSVIDAGKVVCGIGSGFRAVEKVWKSEGCKWDACNPGWELRRADRGHIVKICTHKDADRAVDGLFAKIIEKVDDKGL